MKKRIAESILDECPGVSDNRKQALLAKFGSVERLRKASVEDIAAVEGISEKLAETIVRFLNRKKTYCEAAGLVVLIGDEVAAHPVDYFNRYRLGFFNSSTGSPSDSDRVAGY